MNLSCMIFYKQNTYWKDKMSRWSSISFIFTLFFLLAVVPNTTHHVGAFSTNAPATDIQAIAKLVPQHVANKDLPELTKCIRTLSELKYTDDDNDDESSSLLLVQRLASGSPWKAKFAMSPDDEEGRFLPIGELTVGADGTTENKIDLSIFSVCFRGTFYMSEKPVANKMNIEFQSWQVELFNGLVELPKFGMSNDSAFLKYVRQGGKEGRRKRPNTYLWHFVNDEICVARGSSGNVAMWMVEPKE